MSNSTFTSRKKLLLENRKANLITRYESVFIQLDAILSESDKFPLKQQLKLLEMEIAEVERELENMCENSVQEQLETETVEIEQKVENVSENSVQEQLKTETVKNEQKVENVNENSINEIEHEEYVNEIIKKIYKLVIIVLIPIWLIIGALYFLSYIQPTKKEKRALRQIETELNIKLEKLNEIQWNKVGYTLNENKLLTGLSLYYCDIGNLTRIISPLKDFDNLTKLLLRGNKINDISTLKDLNNLTELVLSWNQISELSSLKNLNNLNKLYLSHNNIKELSPLKNLNNLTILYLSDNEINDITLLKGLNKLQILYLQDNPLEELPIWITDFDMDIYWIEGDSKGIVLYNNPLKKPPVEIVKQGKAAIKQYFEQQKFQLFNEQ